MSVGTATGDPYDRDYADVRRRAASGARAMVVRHVAVAAMSVAGTTYLIRELGPAAWGGFAVSYFLLVSGDIFVARNLLANLARADTPADPEMVRSAARLAIVCGGLLAAGVALLALPIRALYHPPDFSLLLFASAVCLVLYAARAVPLILLERALSYRAVAASEVADVAVFYAVAVPGVAAGKGLEALAVATVARGVTSLGLVRAAQRAPLLGVNARRAASRLLPFGLPLAAVTAIGIVDGLVPALVMGDREREVGYLVTASSILGYGIAALTVLNRVGLPTFARLSCADRRQAVERSLVVAWILTLVVIVPVGGLAGLWVAPLLGSEWRDATEVISLVGVGMLAAAPIGVLSAAIASAGESRPVMHVQILVTGGYLAAAAAMVSLFGPTGCAVAYAVSRWAWAALLTLRARKILGVEPAAVTLRLAVTGVLTYVALWALTTAPIAGAVAGAIAVLVAWMWVSRRELALTTRVVIGRGAAPRNGQAR